jgi:outer membrane protein OmpA-like peptidoglycan-associated protein
MSRSVAPLLLVLALAPAAHAQTVQTPPVAAGPAIPLAPPVIQEAPESMVDSSREARREPPHLTLQGPIGLLRTSAAQVGAAGSWRLALRGEYANSTNFIVRGDRNRRLGGNLALSVTPLRGWEAFAAILAASNHNERCASAGDCAAEPDRIDPPFIRSFGDVVLGTKIAGPIANRTSLGVELGVHFYASDGSLGFADDATSGFVSGLGMLDLRDVRPFPVLLHANLGYVADRSRHLGDFDRLPLTAVNSRAVASFAYGVALPRVRAALGMSAPVVTRSGAAFDPFVEYQLERVTGDPDPGFVDYAEPRCGVAGGKACSDQRVQQRIGIGLRGATPAGLLLDLAIEIAAGSVGVAFGPPLPTWNLVFGIGHAFAPPAPPAVRTVVVERVVERNVERAVGFVGGRVLDAHDGSPIGGSIIDVVGATRARVATDPDGAFVSKGLRPGPVELQISAPGFGAQTLHATVAPGATTAVEAQLVPVQAAEPALTPPPPAASVPAPSAAGGPLGVYLKEGQLVWSRPIRFASAGSPAQLTPDSVRLLDDLVVLLGQHPEIARVHIETHWDSSIGREAAQALTESQAETLAQHLRQRGITGDRIEAIGLGATRPKVLNLGPQSRTRNQRVEITVPPGNAPPGNAPAPNAN